MLIKKVAGKRRLNPLFFSLLCVGFLYQSHTLFGHAMDQDLLSNNSEAARGIDVGSAQTSNETITYYLNISDFALSFIEIPTSDVSGGGTTISSSYLAGRAPIYTTENVKFGTCSASFLNMQTADGIFTDISNFIAADNGVIVTWFTPTTLINLELDSIIHSMVTECMVTASTKVGFNPFYGQTFNLIVSSDNEKIYFEFTRTGSIF